MTSATNDPFVGWAIVELMGHRRMAGWVSQHEFAGHAFLRLDIPGDSTGEASASQLYSPSSVYCLTPTTETMVRAIALRNKPEPVQRWELPQIDAPKSSVEQMLDTCDCGHSRHAHEADGDCQFTTCRCGAFTQDDGAEVEERDGL